MGNSKNKFSHLNLCFFLTDKESSQIKATRNVLKIDASLCLWHMKLSIEKKFKELRKENNPSIKDTQESTLFLVIDTHFSGSAVAFNTTNDHLQKLTLEELDKLFANF